MENITNEQRAMVYRCETCGSPIEYAPGENTTVCPNCNNSNEKKKAINLSFASVSDGSLYKMREEYRAEELKIDLSDETSLGEIVSVQKRMSFADAPRMNPDSLIQVEGLVEKLVSGFDNPRSKGLFETAQQIIALDPKNVYANFIMSLEDDGFAMHAFMKLLKRKDALDRKVADFILPYILGEYEFAQTKYSEQEVYVLINYIFNLPIKEENKKGRMRKLESCYDFSQGTLQTVINTLDIILDCFSNFETAYGFCKKYLAFYSAIENANYFASLLEFFRTRLKDDAILLRLIRDVKINYKNFDSTELCCFVNYMQSKEMPMQEVIRFVGDYLANSKKMGAKATIRILLLIQSLEISEKETKTLISALIGQYACNGDIVKLIPYFLKSDLDSRELLIKSYLSKELPKSLEDTLRILDALFTAEYSERERILDDYVERVFVLTTYKKAFEIFSFIKSLELTDKKKDEIFKKLLLSRTKSSLTQMDGYLTLFAFFADENIKFLFTLELLVSEKTDLAFKQKKFEFWYEKQEISANQLLLALLSMKKLIRYSIKNQGQIPNKFAAINESIENWGLKFTNNVTKKYAKEINWLRTNPLEPSKEIRDSVFSALTTRSEVRLTGSAKKTVKIKMSKKNSRVSTTIFVLSLLLYIIVGIIMVKRAKQYLTSVPAWAQITICCLEVLFAALPIFLIIRSGKEVYKSRKIAKLVVIVLVALTPIFCVTYVQSMNNTDTIFYINSANDLANMVNADRCTFILDTDIIVDENAEFVGIKSFSGVLDGNGNTITMKEGSRIGYMFGYGSDADGNGFIRKNKGEIRNLNFVAENGNFVGVNYGSIQNVSVTYLPPKGLGTPSTYENAPKNAELFLFARENYGEIDNCSFVLDANNTFDMAEMEVSYSRFYYKDYLINLYAFPEGCTNVSAQFINTIRDEIEWVFIGWNGGTVTMQFDCQTEKEG